MNLQKPKAVIFDWDNTLADTWPLIASAMNKALEHMGRESWSMDKIKSDIKKSMRDSFPEIFGNNWQEAGKVYQESYRSRQLTELGLFPSALDFIDRLYKLEIPLFIISNKIGATLRKEVAHLGLDEKFFSIIGSNDANYDKPHRDPVDLALLGSDLNPENDHIWFIGDTSVDVECAYNSGCYPIAFGDCKTIPSNLIAEGRNNQGKIPVFENYQEFLNAITHF